MNLTDEDMESFYMGDQVNKKRRDIITASTALVGLLTEEQWNEIISCAEKSFIIDKKTSYRVMGKLIDLAQAVQDSTS